MRAAVVALLAILCLGMKQTATPRSTDKTPCPDGMIEVEGDYCPWIDQRCIYWLDPPNAFPKLRCAEFHKSGPCLMPTSKKHFCMDTYEWPNRAGAMPAISMTWFDAKASCASIGKRLCGDDEWTLACEGREHLPYPYGYKRDANVCNTDREYITPDNRVYEQLETRAAETARLDQRVPSGSRASCVSAFGVHDMAGNVDEWVVNDTQKCFPHCSSSKGGAWTPVRNRCRPMTTAHEEKFSYYQLGFRCCADIAKK
jgi:hypothetical protein